MANFPMDGAGGLPGPMDGPDNFKKSGKGKFFIIGVLVAALGGAGVVAMSAGSEGPELTVEQAAAEMKNIFVMPKEQQLVEWRKWAAVPGDEGGITEIKQEAIKQLAWARDPDGVPLAAELLKSQTPKLQGMAATALAHYGPVQGKSAAPHLMAALKTAGPGSKPQIAWALAELGEAQAFEEILTLYRAGHLATVQRLGGGNAFNPDKIVAIVPLDTIAALHSDESPSVRQLVATVLSREADPKYTDTLIKLLGDPESDVARQAAPGLGKIGDKKARDPLIARLAEMRDTDQEGRTKYLEALRDGAGGVGLVLALYSVVNEQDVQHKWFARKEIFEMLDELNDPRAADALVEYLQVEEHIHYQYRTAKALAQIGDIRAVPVLAKRMRMDPEKIYSDDYDWEMLIKRDGKERVAASRMLSDLAVLNPDKLETMRKQAEDAIIFWNHERTQPHANGLRAMVNMQSTKDIAKLREWANPKEPLPKEGQQPPMPDAFVIAQSALRYLGVLKQPADWKIFEDTLHKKPEKLSVANEAMYQGGLAILGMSLNALGKGAADGLSEWADPKGFDLLMEYITDEKQNENGRESACAALAWSADQESIIKVAEKISEYNGAEPSHSFIRKCLLETLVQRPVPGTAAALTALMNKDQAIETRTNLARAIAKAGIDDATQEKLLELTKDPALMNDAVLALALGGTPDAAARAIALYADMDKVAVEQLKEMWYKSFGFWSTDDLEKGVLFRYVDNAVAISRVVINATPQTWASEKLSAQFDNLIFDNGPHSFTRVVLRNRLYAMGQGSDAEKAAGAIRTLQFMGEKGTLMALADLEGETGKLATKALFELNNPNLFAAGAGTKAASEAKEE